VLIAAFMLFLIHKQNFSGKHSDYKPSQTFKDACIGGLCRLKCQKQVLWWTWFHFIWESDATKVSTCHPTKNYPATHNKSTLKLRLQNAKLLHSLLYNSNGRKDVEIFNSTSLTIFALNTPTKIKETNKKYATQNL